MAPKGRPAKRASSAAAEKKSSAVAEPKVRPAKKAKVADPRKEQTASIITALRQTQSLDESMRQLLSKMIPMSLGVYSDARHEYQVRIVEMVVEAFSVMEKDMEKSIEDANRKVEFQKNNKAGLDAAVLAAEEALLALKEDEKKNTMARKAADMALTDAVGNLKDAKATHKLADKDIIEVELKKAQIESVIVNSLRPLKEGTLEGPAEKKAEKALLVALKVFGSEDSLVESCKLLLCKPRSDRTAFDATVFETTEAWASKILADVSAQSTNSTPDKEARSQKVVDCTDELAAATKNLDEIKDAREKLAAATAEGAKAVKTAKKNADNWLPDLKGLFEDVNDVKQSLADFRDGPFKAVADMKVKTTPLPETEAAGADDVDGGAEDPKPVEDPKPASDPDAAPEGLPTTGVIAD